MVHKFESLPTKRQGIFVMPVERIAIQASYWYLHSQPVPKLGLLDSGGGQRQ